MTTRSRKAYGGDDPNSPYRFYMSQLTSKLKKSNRLTAFKARPDMTDAGLTYDYIFDNIVIRGSVNRVVDGILALARENRRLRNVALLRQGLG